MKILLTGNGTTRSYAAAQSVADGVWPEGSEVKLLFVIEPPMALASEVTSPLGDFLHEVRKLRAGLCEQRDQTRGRAVASKQVSVSLRRRRYGYRPRQFHDSQ